MRWYSENFVTSAAAYFLLPCKSLEPTLRNKSNCFCRALRIRLSNRRFAVGSIAASDISAAARLYQRPFRRRLAKNRPNPRVKKVRNWLSLAMRCSFPNRGWSPDVLFERNKFDLGRSQHGRLNGLDCFVENGNVLAISRISRSTY